MSIVDVCGVVGVDCGGEEKIKIYRKKVKAGVKRSRETSGEQSCYDAKRER